MNQKKEPRVTVLIPVFNANLFVSESINSILNQTLSDFKLLIIDDGSTDESVRIIKEIQDERIELICLEKNYGITQVLNLGLSLIKSKYIARMDGDDIAFPERLEKQVEFLDKNPNVCCLGTNFEWLNEPNKKSWVQFYDPESIRIALLFGCELCHPTVMIRTSIIHEYNLEYPSLYPHAEDYGFWAELSKYGYLANLPEPLLYYRSHQGQISQTKSSVQCKSIDHIIVNELKVLGIQPSEADLMLHHILGGAFIPLPFLGKMLKNWSKKLIEANASSKKFNAEIFEQQIFLRIQKSLDDQKRKMSEMSNVRRLYWKIMTLFRFVVRKFYKAFSN